MTEFIRVPLKKSTDVNIVKPLRNTLNTIFGSSKKGKDYQEQVDQFAKLRTCALWRTNDRQESSLDLIYRYYDQLNALETKIPSGELQIPFNWKDAFCKGTGIFGGRTSLTISSIGYEKVCVLFNIAALQSSVAATQSMTDDEGLKVAARLFQQSSGIFCYLDDIVLVTLQQDPTPDLSHDILVVLSSLMLAQAQEIFFLKAKHENMKDVVVAKIANETATMYTEIIKLMQKESVKLLWDRDWIQMVLAKEVMYQGIAQFYQSLVCKTNKAVGEQIARLRIAIDNFKTAQAKSSKIKSISDFITRAERSLKEVTKDNDFIYHEKIPEGNKLAPIGRAALAKPQNIPPKLSNNFKDLFDQLIPVAMQQALSEYEKRRNDLVRLEIIKIREATQLMNGVLASLNLPAAVEDCVGQDVPSSLVSKSATMRGQGGLNIINSMLRELPELLVRNRIILSEIERMIHDEKQSDDRLRERFREKWSRKHSAQLTVSFRANIEKYRTTIESAVQADKIVKEKYEIHKNAIELLCKGPQAISAAVPRASEVTEKNSSSINRLRQLMEEVNSLKIERDAIESELKSINVDVKEIFSAPTRDNNVSTKELTEEALNNTYGHLQNKVKESLLKQERLIADLQLANSDFIAERSEKDQATKKRNEVFKNLASAYDAYMELFNNLKEGISFYNELTEILTAFQSKVSDFCFARNAEKEELLKDLTIDLGKEPPANSGSSKANFNKMNFDFTPTPMFPSRVNFAPSTSTAVPHLPYPAMAHSVPLPYNESQNQIPYSVFSSFPMPTGYYTTPYQGAHLPNPQQNSTFSNQNGMISQNPSIQQDKSN